MHFELIKTDDYPDFDLKVTLKPSFRCNQKCWFCEEYDNSTTYWTKEECDIVLNKLKDIPKDRKKIFFYFYGGEPTLNRHWEYLNYELVKIFKDKELFIQTQTNLSIKEDRLNDFLININDIKQDNHIIDICSSYHLGHQTREEFKRKMDICAQHNALGLCFFSTEKDKEHQTISEFNYLCSYYNDRMILRFTDVNDEFEFEFFKDKFSESYFEKGFNFLVDGVIMNFTELYNEGIHKQFRLLKCECGIKNLVIDQDLKVYHCNDDFKNKIGISNLIDIDIPQYISKVGYCMNKECYDGLEFTKWNR